METQEYSQKKKQTEKINNTERRPDKINIIRR